MLGGPAMVSEALVAGSPEALDARLTDGFAAALVLVVRSDIPDGLGKPHPVVLAPYAVQLRDEHGRVGDLLEMRPLGLDVPKEALDPGLVGEVNRLIATRALPACLWTRGVISFSCGAIG